MDSTTTPPSCNYCGKLLPSSNRQYCDATCRNRATNERLFPKQTFICQHCGQQFWRKARGKDDRRFCSRECYFASIAKQEQPREQPVCVICGNAFDGKSGQKYCSHECRKAKGRAAYHRTFVPVAVTNPTVDHECYYCGKRFTTNRYSNGRKFCSAGCAKKQMRVERKAREMGAFVEPVNWWHIYSRDKGKCQICGKPVDKTKHAPHPMAPTLDHIIPLARGGKHEARNIQLAHSRCNSLKGDRGGGQLRLIG